MTSTRSRLLHADLVRPLYWKTPYTRGTPFYDSEHVSSAVLVRDNDDEMYELPLEESVDIHKSEKSVKLIEPILFEVYRSSFIESRVGEPFTLGLELRLESQLLKRSRHFLQPIRLSNTGCNVGWYRNSRRIKVEGDWTGRCESNRDFAITNCSPSKFPSSRLHGDSTRLRLPRSERHGIHSVPEHPVEKILTVVFRHKE